LVGKHYIVRITWGIKTRITMNKKDFEVICYKDVKWIQMSLVRIQTLDSLSMVEFLHNCELLK
jgi:hypothetical protein